MVSQENKTERYDSINGLRTIACIGIVLMHVKTNISYILNGYWLNTVINEFSNFVFLFMIISSFGMCCGYFNKIKNNEITFENFYSKRFKKIMPFFVSLLLLDLIIERSLSALIETFANATMMFGFLQKDIEILGVAWFLGLIFIFYFIFPYFVYLFSNKKRAWFTTFIALLMNLTCIYYFDVGRANMFYSFIYFCIGGLIYLYKSNIISFFENKKILNIALMFTTLIIYFVLPLSNKYFTTIRYIVLFVPILIYAITYNSYVLNNRITSFVGNISLEVYLCHMAVFRIVEKIYITKLFSNYWVSYIITSIIVLIGAIFVSVCFQYVWNRIERVVFKNESIVS